MPSQQPLRPLRWPRLTRSEQAVLRGIILKPFLEGDTITGTPTFKSDPKGGLIFGTVALADGNTEVSVPITPVRSGDYDVWCKFTQTASAEVREVGPIRLKVVDGGHV